MKPFILEHGTTFDVVIYDVDTENFIFGEKVVPNLQHILDANEHRLSGLELGVWYHVEGQYSYRFDLLELVVHIQYEYEQYYYFFSTLDALQTFLATL